MAELERLFRDLQWSQPRMITQLHGDASARQYFRIRCADGRTIIMMQMPVGAASVSEEITNFRGTCDEPPFIAMHRVLTAAALPTPALLHDDRAERRLFLEDLGDTPLATLVLQATSAERIAWYQRAIDLLVTMQAAMAAVPAAQSLAAQRSFDAALLNWEFDHFAEYALAARGAPLRADAARHFQEASRCITQILLALPSAFTHRDFQSRNLMWHGERLCLIDFQDALCGPYIYDLVSLLRDSYVPLTTDELTTLLRYFADATRRDLSSVTEHFHVMTIQRKMKDAGRFLYIDRVKGNPNFLQYLPTSLTYVHDALAAIPRFAPLIATLRPSLPEWQETP